MRYAGWETPIAVAVLPAAGVVRVQVLEQLSNSLLALATDLATLTPIAPNPKDGMGLWQWPLTNIADAIVGFAQLVIVFHHEESGARDFCKMVVRGVIDDITKTRRLVATLL
jgi:hypothetical protein